ncbi:MAG TPA: indolepyruvate oxidoreductase subunit beta [Bacillota bacterium]|nr:indolepyruvate oxidoreductase subunit beta [Bacillota bacterium]HQD51809.1 indolepyruvate oxidoreductase subunit beta [Bacillota bacterium]
MTPINKTDLLITGVGGQGTLLTGKIIAAAALAEGYDVKTSETHGMAQRGGSVVIHVRIAGKVYAPLIPPGEADFLLAFEKLEALRFLPCLSPKGTVIVNRQAIKPLPVLTGACAYPAGITAALAAHAKQVIPVNATAMEPVCRHPRTANLLLLGVLAHQLPFPQETWHQAILRQIPAQHLQINRQAFTAGWEVTGGRFS